MHFTEVWSIVESNIEIQNPVSAEKLDLLADYCHVRDNISVLDVGCGKGWLLRSWASRWAIDGTGLEINPWFLAHAHRQAEAAGVTARLRFIEGPARDFTPEPSHYDAVLCVGASFALGGFESAVAWMQAALKLSGVIAIGDVFAAETPFPPEGRGQQAPTLAGRIDSLQKAGFDVIAMIAASQDDFDRYASEHWRALHTWAAANAEHPDCSDLVRSHKASRERYLAWERRYIGWAIFVAKRSLTL
jgi:cyclopropane fatty-acyl-phospholipid synthase-like methyltransferase